MDIQGDAAKDFARVVRDGSTTEGQLLRERLWVRLRLQDEEATELVPKQIQSSLDREENATAKGIQKKQGTEPFTSGLDRDLLSTTNHSPRSQTRTSHEDPDQPRLDGGLGRNHSDRTRQVEGHPNATKIMDDNPQNPVRAFLEYVSAQREDARFSGTSEKTRECLGVARSGHVGCADPASDGQEVSVRTSGMCVVMEHRDGLLRGWA